MTETYKTMKAMQVCVDSIAKALEQLWTAYYAGGAETVSIREAQLTAERDRLRAELASAREQVAFVSAMKAGPVPIGKQVPVGTCGGTCALSQPAWDCPPDDPPDIDRMTGTEWDRIVELFKIASINYSEQLLHEAETGSPIADCTQESLDELRFAFDALLTGEKGGKPRRSKNWHARRRKRSPCTFSRLHCLTPN